MAELKVKKCIAFICSFISRSSTPPLDLCLFFNNFVYKFMYARLLYWALV